MTGTCAGVVLAGTYPWGGSRFERLLPRPLVPIAGRPLITYALRWLEAGGAGPITICTNGSVGRFEEALGAGLAADVEYYQDWTPRGVAGCARDAGLAGSAARVIAVDATVLPGIDLRALLDAHLASGTAATVVVGPIADPAARLAHPALEPLGIAVLERRALELVPDTGFQDLKEGLIPRLHAAGAGACPFVADASCPRVVDADGYLRVNALATARAIATGAPPPGYDRRGEAFVHATAVVDPAARLIGPVIVGPWAAVLSGAVVVGSTTIAAHAVVGADALVARSALWAGAAVGERARVDRCVVGVGAEVEPGATIEEGLVGAPARRGRGGSAA